VADELEREYQGNVDDYIHDLSKRDLLQEVLDALPRPLRRKIELQLGPIDMRFQRMTREDPTRILRRVTHIGDGWWWSRLPERLNKELEETLRPFREPPNRPSGEHRSSGCG
jgi:hypothetical protein